MIGKTIEMILVFSFGYITYQLFKNHNIKKKLRLKLIICTSILTLLSLFIFCMNSYMGTNNTTSKTKRQITTTSSIQSKSSKKANHKYNSNDSQNIKLVLRHLQQSAKVNGENTNYYLQNGNIVVLIKNSDVVPPVTTIENTKFLKDIFRKIYNVQKKYSTNYPILFTDNNEIIAYTTYDGYGWYKDLTNNEESKKNCNFMTNIDK